MNSARRVVIVVSDLFFYARIRTTGAHLGIEVEETPAGRLAETCRRSKTDLVLVDLHSDGGPLEAVKTLKLDATCGSIPVVGFYSHVDDATRRAAIEAGVDRVLPRSAFTIKLADILEGKYG